MILFIPLLIIATRLGVYLPTPHDKDGWGLRIHNVSTPGPYLRGESLGRVQYEVTVINFSENTREHDPLPVARATHDLDLSIIQPDGKPVRSLGMAMLRDPFTQPFRLRPGEFSSDTFRFGARAAGGLQQLGRHRVEATIKIDGMTIPAPPVEFEVIEPATDAILMSHTIPLEGSVALRPALEQHKPLIQQIQVGKRTWLFYRHADSPKAGGRIFWGFRLAELPGKCEMKVEGAYGAGKPLTIIYKDVKSPTGTTKLVINSIDGTQWTPEDEAALREEGKTPTPQPIPAPQPAKP